MLVIVMAELWAFFSVTLWTELIVPWTWLPNATLVGLTVTVWASAGSVTNATKQARSHERYSPGPFRINSTAILNYLLQNPGPARERRRGNQLSALKLS
jgi:hypothetical protein